MIFSLQEQLHFFILSKYDIIYTYLYIFTYHYILTYIYLPIIYLPIIWFHNDNHRYIAEHKIFHIK